MKRSELYKRVWETPMMHLAAELGISDVGLAKACRRHAIPVPPRGHWAKLRAGKKSAQPALPAPELDVVVDFARHDPQETERWRSDEQKRQTAAAAAAKELADNVKVTVVEDLSRAHPLVRATQKYLDKLPALIEKSKRNSQPWRAPVDSEPLPPEKNGRYLFVLRGLLDLTVSLDAAPWVLRFHASIFKGFTDAGMVIEHVEGRPGVSSRIERLGCVIAKFRGESFSISFSQGYTRIERSAEKVREEQKKYSWARTHEYVPSQRFTLSLKGSVYGCDRSWQGGREALEAKCAEIVRAGIELAPYQAQLRRERYAAEQERQRLADIASKEQRRRQARAEQVERLGRLIDAREALERQFAFLAWLESGAAQLVPPFDERLSVWIKVVREELARKDPVREQLLQCLSPSAWGRWPPDWWPGEQGGEGDQQAAGD